MAKFYSREMDLEGSQEKNCIRFTQSVQYRPKIMGFIYYV